MLWIVGCEHDEYNLALPDDEFNADGWCGEKRAHPPHLIVGAYLGDFSHEENCLGHFCDYGCNAEDF